jgi:hypothetical protein
MVETFTLVVWIMMGQRFEETRVVDLTRAECVERAMVIEADRGKAKVQCMGPNGYVFPREIRSLPPCATGSKD